MNKLNASLALLLALSVSPSWAALKPSGPSGEKPCLSSTAGARGKVASKAQAKACALTKTCPVEVASSFHGNGRTAR